MKRRSFLQGLMGSLSALVASKSAVGPGTEKTPKVTDYGQDEKYTETAETVDKAISESDYILFTRQHRGVKLYYWVRAKDSRLYKSRGFEEVPNSRRTGNLQELPMSVNTKTGELA